MIGRYQIGNRWLGSGRSQLPEYVTLSASIQLNATASSSVRSAAGISGSISLTASCDSELIAGKFIDGSVNLNLSPSALPSINASLSGIVPIKTQPQVIATKGVFISGLSSLTARISSKIRKRLYLVGSYLLKVAPSSLVTRGTHLSSEMDANSTVSCSLLRAKNLSSQTSFGMTMTGAIGIAIQETQISRYIVLDERDKYISVPEKKRYIVFLQDDRGGPMEIFQKQPLEVVDYTIVMDEWFSSIPNDYIVGITNLEAFVNDDPDELGALPADIVFGPDGKPQWETVGDPALRVAIWIGGGLSNVSYKIQCLVETNDGRKEQVEFLVNVEDK